MATNKNRALFEGALDTPGAAQEPTGPDEQHSDRGRHRYLEGRKTALARIAAGELVNKTLHLVDPARCKIWEHHNRSYELLNEMRCKDLIDSIKAQGGQEFPAIVRAISDDPSCDYEVICGARRHWAVAWLRAHHYDHRFLVEIRDLSDEEAFRLSDIENRDREDISDYERATDYTKALSRFYKTQEEMAERLEVTTTWLSRYLALAELPEEIIHAYPDVTHIKVDHASQLMPLLRKDRQIRAKVLARAVELAAEQTEARVSGKTGPDGRTVFKELKVAATRRISGPKGVLQLYKSKMGMKPMLEVKRQGRSGLVMRIIPGSGADRAELVEACEKALIDYL